MFNLPNLYGTISHNTIYPHSLRYHHLELNPHGIEEPVTLRWLLDGEPVPQVLTEAELQQREINQQLELRRQRMAQREKDLQRVYNAIDTEHEKKAGLEYKISGFLQSPSTQDNESDAHPSESLRRYL